MYVQRNQAGIVVGVYANPQPGIAQEQVANDHPEVLAITAPTPGIPQAVTMRQARLALLGAGVLAGVDAFIDSLPSPQKEAARIEWEYAATVERQSQLVSSLSAALSLDGAALDALFIAAAAL